MPPKSLSKQVGETFRDNKLVTRVARHISVREDSGFHRKGIYPSELSHSKDTKCLRAIHYRLTDVPPAPQPVSIVSQRIFDTGDKAHEWWQQRFWEMEILKGFFFCMRCELYWEDLSPYSCPRCDASKDIIQYREVPFRSQRYGVVGRADADTTTDGLIEIKTIGVGSIRWEAPHLVEKHGTDWDALWRDIKHPFPSHRKQGMLYCYFKEREEITFIYDPKFVSAAPKEFVVKFRQDYVDEMLQECEEILENWEANQVPRRPPWAARDNNTCLSCPFKKHCYTPKR